MADVPDIHDIQEAGAEQRRLQQIERELVMLAEGAAALERGESYKLETIEAWLDALDADPNAKFPPFDGRS